MHFDVQEIKFNNIYACLPSSDHLAKPYAFFTVINYDQGVLPDFKPGESLQPLVPKFEFVTSFEKIII
jgi:hypothetical protein